MIVIYSKLLNGYIVERHTQYGRSMLAVDQDRSIAIEKALTRLLLSKSGK